MPTNSKLCNEWRSRSTSKTDDPVPKDLLSCLNVVVSRWLCHFIQETRKINGIIYPPPSLHSLRLALLNKLLCCFFDPSDNLTGSTNNFINTGSTNVT